MLMNFLGKLINLLLYYYFKKLLTLNFLSKKRKDFVNRMRNKVIKDGKSYKPTFLGRKASYLDIDDQQLCMENNNEMSWSIQEENLSKDEEIMSNYYNRESNE